MPETGARRRRDLLSSSNRKLARDQIRTWSLPALAARLPSGKTILTCPSASACALACYARSGSYMWPTVKAAHVRNLEMVVEDLEGWEATMNAELARPRLRDIWVRIHDSGDFFSDDYLLAWLRIIRARPQTFYAYTKEVDRFRRLVEPDPPPNFHYVFSYGGKQDQALDPGRGDRVADVFPTEADIEPAGYTSQAASDRHAVTNPSPLVGMGANNIPRARRLQGNRSFRQWQEDLDRWRERRTTAS